MKYLLMLTAILLTGCAAVPPQLTNVVTAPVRVSCVVVMPAPPILLTPCPSDGASDACFIDYMVDNTALLGYVAKLTAQLKACI